MVQKEAENFKDKVKNCLGMSGTKINLTSRYHSEETIIERDIEKESIIINKTTKINYGKRVFPVYR